MTSSRPLLCYHHHLTRSCWLLFDRTVSAKIVAGLFARSAGCRMDQSCHVHGWDNDQLGRNRVNCSNVTGQRHSFASHIWLRPSSHFRRPHHRGPSRVPSTEDGRRAARCSSTSSRITWRDGIAHGSAAYGRLIFSASTTASFRVNFFLYPPLKPIDVWLAGRHRQRHLAALMGLTFP